MHLIATISFLFMLLVMTIDESCDVISDEVHKETDTLDVGFTYWWMHNGPFPVLEEYNIVAQGQLVKTDTSEFEHTLGGPDVEYYIALTNVLFNYDNELGIGSDDGQVLKTDAFHSAQVEVGDELIIFIYLYEGGLAMPRKSYLKVNGRSEEAVALVSRYLLHGKEAVKKDLDMWSSFGVRKNARFYLDPEGDPPWDDH